MTEWFFNGGNPVCKRWHEALVDEVGGKLEGMRELFHEELEKEYRNEEGQLLKEELVNLGETESWKKAATGRVSKSPF